jgi:hypothetical protein
MFLIPCKYISSSPIIECVESIQIHHPNEKIVIIDSCSENTDYLNLLVNKKNIIILNTCNLNYVIGALWKTYSVFPDEPFYVLLHDSIILKKTIPANYLTDQNFYTFMYFHEKVQNKNTPEYAYYTSVLNKTGYIVPSPDDTIYGCFGTIGIFKQNFIKALIKNNIHGCLPTSKFECNMYERILGICAFQENFNPKYYNLEGNYLEKTKNVHNDTLSYIKKLYFYNKR